jgi:transcription initiation factor TFIID subunit TAF12
MRSEVADTSWLQLPVIKRALAVVIVASLVAANSARGQTSQSHVYPAKGQSQAQMDKDTAECRGIATQSTGYNPSTGQAATAATSRPRGGRGHGAARGALAGAARAEVKGQQYEAYDNAPEELKQEYRQNQAGSGAYVGAAVGGAASRRQRRQLGQQQQSQQASFEQAYRSCLIGRGYTVQ